jgi:hypothetical protein
MCQNPTNQPIKQIPKKSGEVRTESYEIEKGERERHLLSHPCKFKSPLLLGPYLGG